MDKADMEAPIGETLPLRDIMPTTLGHLKREPSLNDFSQSRTQPKSQPRLTPPDERLCPECHGIGFVYVADVASPTGYLADTSKYTDVMRCTVCGPGRQMEYLVRLDGLTPEMRQWTFDNSRPTHKPIYDAAREVLDYPRWFFTVHGENGVGKTRLLSCIVNAGRAARWTSVYITTAALLDHLRTAYAPDSKVSFDGLWDKVVKAKILAIDEMDRWSPTAWAQEKFFQLIDERYRNGAERMTVFATNLNVGATDKIPEYVTSRMFDRRCQVHHMAGADIRRVRR